MHPNQWLLQMIWHQISVRLSATPTLFRPCLLCHMIQSTQQIVWYLLNMPILLQERFGCRWHVVFCYWSSFSHRDTHLCRHMASLCHSGLKVQNNTVNAMTFVSRCGNIETYRWHIACIDCAWKYDIGLRLVTLYWCKYLQVLYNDTILPNMPDIPVWLPSSVHTANA